MLEVGGLDLVARSQRCFFIRELRRKIAILKIRGEPNDKLSGITVLGLANNTFGDLRGFLSLEGRISTETNRV